MNVAQKATQCQTLRLRMIVSYLAVQDGSIGFGGVRKGASSGKGYPQCGQVTAFVLILCPHSGQFVIAIFFPLSDIRLSDAYYN